MSIGNQIQNLRAERGWTRRDLSLISGLSQQVLYTVEHDKHHPNRITLVRLALAFSLPPDAFIQWHEPEERRKFPLVLLVAQVKLGATTKEISEKTGISELVLSFYHRGRSQPDNLKTIVKLATALNIEVSDLVKAWDWGRLSQECRKTEDGKLFCCSCKIPKEPEAFHSLTASVSGKGPMCKECREKRRKGEKVA